MNDTNVFSASLKGLRDKNEDTHDIILNLDGKDGNIAPVNFYAVFDGHGSGHVSKYLKGCVSKYFVNKKVIYPLRKKYVTDVFNHIQSDIGKYSFSNYSGSTCLIVIHFRYRGENYINIINSGDSRCVLNRDGFAVPMSKDHKPNWPDELNRITRLGGKIVYDGNDWRIGSIKDANGNEKGGGLSVSRSFGDVDSKPYVDHLPDLFSYKLTGSDKFMVLSCDGLYESMSSEQVINFVIINCYNLENQSRMKSNANIAKKLAEHAINKGSTDNVSTIVVFF